MNATQVLIGSCAACIYVIIIETFDRVRMHIRMDRRVAALNLAQNTVRGKRCGDQATSNNREQTKIQHRAILFGRMKAA